MVKEKQALVRQYISSKIVVCLIFLVCLFSFGFDYFLNITTPRALYENALIILSFMSCMLFILMGYGLYFGLKMKDTIGMLTDRIDTKKLPDFSGGAPDVSELIGSMGSIAEGLGGFLIALLAAFIFVILGWTIVLLSWYFILFLAAILYWIVYRAIRIVLKYSMQCQGNWTLSLKYSFLYTLLYTSWVYGIILALHFIQH